MSDLLPISADEPRPWTVSIWRYGSEEREPFVLREDAVDYAALMSDSDSCWVEGVHAPDGSLDRAATTEAMPWRKWE